MEWFNEMLEKLQAGDIQTAIIVLFALLISFFFLKILLNSFKAIIIILAAIVVLAVLLPDVKIIDKAKEIGSDTANFIKEQGNENNLESLKKILN